MVSVRAPSQSATSNLVEFVPRSSEASLRDFFTPAPCPLLDLVETPSSHDAPSACQPVSEVGVQAFDRALPPPRDPPFAQPVGRHLSARPCDLRLDEPEALFFCLEPQGILPGPRKRLRESAHRPFALEPCRLATGARARQPQQRWGRPAFVVEWNGQYYGGYPARAPPGHIDLTTRIPPQLPLQQREVIVAGPLEPRKLIECAPRQLRRHWYITVI